jgi:hypothetical protein
MPPITGIVWDACGLLNLVATGREEEILGSLRCPSCVVRQVRIGEVLYLRPLPEEDQSGARALLPIGLMHLLDSGLLQDMDLDEAEQATFVQFAAVVDDGEAKSAAAAMHRGMSLATDDRATIRLLATLPTPVPALTTLEWVKLWADQSAASAAEPGELIRRIEIRANFLPPRVHPLRGWWNSHRPPSAG